MLPTILLVLAALVIVLLIVAATRPDDFRVSRNATLAASPATVFAHINDFHRWEAWSPWAKLDPACKNNFAGASAGVGANFSWDGNNKVGAGSMTITESRPGELVRIRLEFLRPFKATNTAEFTFAANGPQTVVTWTMTGKNNLMSKIFGLFVNCDKMVGGDFEKGLASLKGIVEAKK